VSAGRTAPSDKDSGYSHPTTGPSPTDSCSPDGSKERIKHGVTPGMRVPFSPQGTPGLFPAKCFEEPQIKQFRLATTHAVRSAGDAWSATLRAPWPTVPWVRSLNTRPLDGRPTGNEMKDALDVAADNPLRTGEIALLAELMVAVAHTHTFPVTKWRSTPSCTRRRHQLRSGERRKGLFHGWLTSEVPATGKHARNSACSTASLLARAPPSAHGSA